MKFKFLVTCKNGFHMGKYIHRSIFLFVVQKPTLDTKIPAFWWYTMANVMLHYFHKVQKS